MEIISNFPDKYINMIFDDTPNLLSNDCFTFHSGRMVSEIKASWILVKVLMKIKRMKMTV
jgi:hypothetical protein